MVCVTKKFYFTRYQYEYKYPEYNVRIDLYYMDDSQLIGVVTGVTKGVIHGALIPRFLAYFTTIA